MEKSDRLLVVEDEADILGLVLRHLRSNGFLPNGFADPVAALEEFRTHPARYPLVLTDVKMPGINGIDLAREILKTNPETKVVLMTAHEYYEDEILSGLPKMMHDDIIKKPFKLTEICDRVKKYVRAE